MPESITDTINEYGIDTPLGEDEDNERVSKIIDHFHHKDIECATYLTRNSHYCGYARMPEELVGKARTTSNYDEIEGYIPPDLSVHGGVTYGPDDDNWIGFDTAHAWDGNFDENMEELLNTIGSIGDPEHIWTPESVKEETEHLAEQLADLMELHGSLDNER